MKWQMICVAVLGCMSGWQSAHADEPGARRPASGATTKPFLEPGDVGQTTVAPSTEDGPLPIAIRWWGQGCDTPTTRAPRDGRVIYGEPLSPLLSEDAYGPWNSVTICASPACTTRRS